MRKRLTLFVHVGYHYPGTTLPLGLVSPSQAVGYALERVVVVIETQEEVKQMLLGAVEVKWMLLGALEVKWMLLGALEVVLLMVFFLTQQQ